MGDLPKSITASIYVVIIIFVIVVYSQVKRTFFTIDQLPSIPQNILASCPVQIIPNGTIVNTNGSTQIVPLKITGHKNGLCEVVYTPSAGIDLMVQKTYYFSEKGNLCGYHDFNTNMSVSPLVCDFFPLQ